MPGSTLPQKTKPTDDSHPYGLPWLDSCYQETLLPTGPWMEVSQRICDALAPRIRKQFNYPERKQMIFELMGLDYIKQYFPDEDYNPLVLEPPFKSKEDRKKLQIDAQNWLQKAIASVTKETGTQRPQDAEETGETLQPPTKDFLAHTKMIFRKGMDRRLLLLEREIQEDRALDQWQKEQQKEAARDARERLRERARLQQERQRLYGDINTPGLRSILKNADENPQTRLTTASTIASRPVTANVKGALFHATADPPRFWSMQSDSLGRSLVAILKRDPRRMAEITGKLRGRQLPGSLRKYVWTDMLLKHERNQHDINTESVIRERFVRAVKAGMSNLNIKKATNSPVQSLIENAVVETFQQTPGMREYKDDTVFMKETSRSLNVLYVFDRSYEPYLIHWLFPLQLCYEDSVGEGEHVYELAMYLDLLNKSMFPKWPEIFATAEKVMQRLAEGDPELHKHLKDISQRDVTVNPKEFMVQLIHQEMSEAEVLLQKEGTYSSADPSGRLLADPLIFLRKWIGEGFVGVLDTQASLFIWDQNFMQQWHLRVMEDTCLALLLLLRHKFMQANNYITMKKVFLEQPSLLYTMDIQKAWVHLQFDRPFEAVPPMNRLRPETRDSTPVPQRPVTADSLTSVVLLEPFVVGRLRPTLIFGAESVQQERWLKDLRMDKLSLECHLYFGDSKIQTTAVQKTPILIDQVKDEKYGGFEYKIEYRPDEIRCSGVDVGRYDLEMEMGGYPYAIIEIKYTNRQGESIPLGWSRIKLFQHRSELEDDGVKVSGSNPWILLAKDQFIPIYSGPPLDKFAGEGQTPGPSGRDSPGRRSIDTLFLEKYADLLADGSQLGIHVYNPRNKPSFGPTPRPKSRRISLTPTPRPPTIPVPPPDTRPPPKTATPNPRSPKDLTVTDTFDIYVDQVKNLPDNASIVKVTGRLVKTGEVKDVKDLLALPDLKSSARNPTFQYQYRVNPEKKRLNPDLIILLRIYTIDVDTKELVVVGSCFFEAFNDKQLLKVGSHIRQVHSGLPDIKQGVKALNHNSLDKGPRIPGCTLYFRLEKAEKSYKKPPKENQYKLDDMGMNQSEKKVIKSYAAEKTTTVEQAIKQRQLVENVPDKDKKGPLLPWLQERLDQKRQLPPNEPADDLDLHRVVRYRQNIGFLVNVVGAYGLPEGFYYQCFATTLPGKEAVKMRPTKEGYGKQEKLRSLKHDWQSLQKSPQWVDQHQEWHPHLDQYSVMFVQIFQYAIKYTPTKDSTGPGTVTTAKGKPFSVKEEDVFGWTIVPLFEKDYVLNGAHHAPIFKGTPTQQILDDFKTALPEQILQDRAWAKSSIMEGAAMIIDVWDGHFRYNEIPGDIQRTDFLLDCLGNRQSYERNEADTKGKKMNELVVKHLDKKHQKTSSDVYVREQGYFEEAIEEAYQTVMGPAMAQGKVGML